MSMYNSDYLINFSDENLAIYAKAMLHNVGDEPRAGRSDAEIATEHSGDTRLELVWENGTHFSTHSVDSGIEVLLVINKRNAEVISSAEVC